MATIANAHADYVIRNMRTAFQNRGRSEVYHAWWNGNADHPRLYPALAPLLTPLSMRKSRLAGTMC